MLEPSDELDASRKRADYQNDSQVSIRITEWVKSAIY